MSMQSSTRTCTKDYSNLSKEPDYECLYTWNLPDHMDLTNVTAVFISKSAEKFQNALPASAEGIVLPLPRRSVSLTVNRKGATASGIRISVSGSVETVPLPPAPLNVAAVLYQVMLALMHHEPLAILPLSARTSASALRESLRSSGLKSADYGTTLRVVHLLEGLVQMGRTKATELLAIVLDKAEEDESLLEVTDSSNY
jgi:hypothetical protein